MKPANDFKPKLVARENLPLYGKRVMFTTPRNYAGSLGKLLLERGARLVWTPTIEIWPMQDYRELDQAIDNLADYAWIGFTSENGIEAYCNRLAAKGIDGRSIKSTKLAAFKADARAFVPWGITPDLLPEESSPKGIIDELVSRGVNSGKILVPVPEVSGVQEPYVVPEFIEQLQKIGMTTHRVPAYRTMAVTQGIDVELRMLLNREIDCIVFTSSAEIFSLLDQLRDKRDILKDVVTAYMGTFTSRTGMNLKLRQDVVPEKFTMQDLLDAMEAYFRK